MGYAPSSQPICPDVQVKLNDYFLTCNASQLREPTPLFDFLMSPLNRTGYSQVVSPAPGKLKTIVTTYPQRILESAVTQPGGARSCTSTTKRGRLTSQCEIDPDDYWEVDEVIEIADLTYACENNVDLVTEKIMMLRNALMAKIATDATSQAIALLGNWDVNVANVVADYLQVQTQKTGSTDISPNAFEKIDAGLMLTNYCAGAAIFSGTTLWEYYRLMLAGCCADQGIALDEVLRLYGKSVMFDKRVHKAVGANKAIAIQPGSMQVATYNEAGNGIAGAAGVVVGTNYQNQIVLDPETGFPIDFTVKDECPGKLHLFMRGTIKVCGLPADMFAPGDDMEGVTWVNGIQVVNT